GKGKGERGKVLNFLPFNASPGLQLTFLGFQTTNYTDTKVVFATLIKIQSRKYGNINPPIVLILGLM
ncbi:hypothetical protein, partial [Nostoc linckia]